MFCPVSIFPDSTRLPMAQLSTGQEILRVIAVSRILLDSIPHIKAYRMNIGDELAELALQFELMTSMGPFSKNRSCILLAQCPLSHDLKQLSKLVKSAGCVPVKRNTIYTSFEAYVPQNLLSGCQWHEVLSMMKQTPRWMNTIGRVAFMNCDPLFVGWMSRFMSFLHLLHG